MFKSKDKKEKKDKNKKEKEKEKEKEAHLPTVSPPSPIKEDLKEGKKKNRTSRYGLWKSAGEEKDREKDDDMGSTNSGHVHSDNEEIPPSPSLTDNPNAASSGTTPPGKSVAIDVPTATSKPGVSTHRWIF